MATLFAALALSPSASAQEFPIDPYAPAAPSQSGDQGSTAGGAGQTGNAGVGEIGQRQSREDAAPNLDTLGRVAARIENRVQNRIRNRIDRNYDPVANASLPFQRAENRARGASNPKRR